MEYQTECGCIVVSSPPNYKIKYCRLHKSAPDLYEACKWAIDIVKDIPKGWITYSRLQKAITKVEGG